MFSPAVVAPEQGSADDLFFLFQGAELLVIPDNESVVVPRRHQLQLLGSAPEQTHYLGSIGNVGCFAAPLAEDHNVPAEWGRFGLRALFSRLGDPLFAVAGRGIQVLQWDETHRFCGRCGQPTERSSVERSRVCPACDLTSYPRLAPAMMALVRRGNELLLARSPHFPEGMFSALAGFVEPGESLEETLHREVREEVGIAITNLRYFGSQPWPFPHSLMIAFVADYLSGEITPQPGEIEAAEWFGIDRLPRLPHRISIARQLIDACVADIAQTLTA